MQLNHNFVYSIIFSILAFVFVKVRTSSALVRTSVFLKPFVRGQVYIFEISPPLPVTCIFFLFFKHYSDSY